jgi:hypothetical protein
MRAEELRFAAAAAARRMRASSVLGSFADLTTMGGHK